MSFADRIKATDSTIYREFTDELFKSYLGELRMVSSANNVHTLQTAQARMNILVEQLRAYLRTDDPRIQYLP